MAENEDTELPDLRVVVITFDQDEDQLRIDTGEDIGDFEALGFLCVAFARQLAVGELRQHVPRLVGRRNDSPVVQLAQRRLWVVHGLASPVHADRQQRRARRCGRPTEPR